MNDLSKAFGSALFYKLFIPGLILAIGVHPLVRGISGAEGWVTRAYPGGAGALFLAEVVTFGLVGYAASIPIYHCAQGLVLPWITWPARRFNRWRFKRKYNAFAQAYGDKSYSEVGRSAATKIQQQFVYLSDYPIEQDEHGTTRFMIRYATRVGNITATYERYPDSRYGINAEAYWEHFMLLLPAEARREIDSVQATAVGTLLASAAGWVVTAFALLLLLASWVGATFPRMAVAPSPASSAVLVGLLLYGVVTASGFNYLTRVAHREYGRLFRACFDVHVGLLLEPIS